MASYRYAPRGSQGNASAFEGTSGQSCARARVAHREAKGARRAAPVDIRGLENAVRAKRVTYEFARQMPGVSEVRTSSLGDGIITGIGA